jgi:hypothetical protein
MVDYAFGSNPNYGDSALNLPDQHAPRLHSFPDQKQSAPAKASGTMDCFAEPVIAMTNCVFGWQ